MAEIRLKKRYKYAGDVFQELVEHAGFQPEVAAALLNDIPDADVAPRAEVDFLKKTIAENAQKALEVTLEEVENAKREVAREIFEEIERLITKECLVFKDENGIRGYVDASVHYAIAELKNKYLGG